MKAIQKEKIGNMWNWRERVEEEQRNHAFWTVV